MDETLPLETTQEDWHRLQALFDAALELPPAERESFVTRETVAGTGLRRDLEQMLAHAEGAGERIARTVESVAQAAAVGDWIGRRIGPYRIVREIGRGGMGMVFEAIRDDDEYRKVVALKIAPGAVLLSKSSHPDPLGERFRAERQILAGLEHPNIARFLDGGTQNGIPYFAMEYVEGRPITEYARSASLGLGEKIALFRQVCSAVDCAHQSLVVHRDLKPGNILVSGEGVPKLLDFGIAKLLSPFEDGGGNTLSGTALWTPDYASPEQVRAQLITTRTDLYSLGLILFELLTGERGQIADTSSPMAMERSICEVETARPSARAPHAVARQFTGDLDTIVAKATQKDPQRRYASAAELSEDLERYLDGRPVRARKDSAAYRASKFLRRNWLTVGAAMGGAALALCAMLAIRVVAFQLDGTNAAPTRAPVPVTAYRGDETWPDFSPDGSQVTFAWNGEHRGDSHIYVKRIGAANHLQLTNGDGSDNFPAWSPDGRWIAFQKLDRAGSHTMLVSPLGGPARTVGDQLCSGKLAWSNDSEWLVCTDLGERRGLIGARTEGGVVRRITSPAIPEIHQDPAFSPGEQKLLFARCAGGDAENSHDCDLELLELNPDLSAAGPARQITHQHAGHSGGLTWSADGRDSIWSMTMTSLATPTLYRTPVFRTGPPQLLPFAGNAGSPVVARHRNRLAYSRFANENHIWRADGHTSARHSISSTQNESSPRFSPDGRRIAFESNRSGTEEIWVANVDGSQQVQLTSFGRHSGSPSWSPDGRWILYDSFGVEGRSDIWAMDASGGASRQITKGPGNSNVPSCSHDGRFVYFYGTRTGRMEIFRIPFAGGAPSQLTHNGGSYPQESEDGKTLYYVKSGSLWQVPVLGGEARPVGINIWNREYLVVSDGIYLIALAGDEAHKSFEIRFFDFAARAQRTIQVLGDVRIYNHSGLAVSPDRKTFLYPVEEGTGADVMLVENLR